MKIIRNTNLCYACKTCQLVCSFHHTKTFWPDQSSIWVSRDPQNGMIEWDIKTTCDGCLLCVGYCIYGAIRAVKETVGNKEK